MRALRHAAALAAVMLLAAGCANQGPESSPDETRPHSDITSGSLPVSVPDLEGCSTLSRRSPPPADGGDRLRAVDLPCLTAGPAVNLAELADRPTVVNLWASWCQPCREEMPLLEAAHRRYEKQVQFIGVNTRDRADWAADFLQQVNATYPEVVDADGQLLTSLRSPGLPVTVILDRDGRVVDRQIGRLREDRLTAMLKTVTP